MVGRLLAEERQPSALVRWVTPLVLFLAGVAFYCALSFYRYAHYGSTAFDLAIQAQAIWGYSHLAIIPNTVLGIRNDLGDHFDPILTILAPADWIWQDPRNLLVVQALLLSGASVPVYVWARARLGYLSAIALQLSHLLFWGILAGVAFDFHHVAFAVLGLSVALYAALTRRNALLWGMTAVGLLTREDVSLTFLFLGLVIAVFQRRWRLGLSLAAISAAYFLAAYYFILPALSGVGYRHWYYDELGPSPLPALVHVLTHPVQSLRLLFHPLEKAKTIAALIASWGAIPLLTPVSLISIPSFLERFWSVDPNLWTPRFQYSMIFGPTFAFSAVQFFAWMRARRPLVGLARLGALAVLLINVSVSFFVVRPFAAWPTYLTGKPVAQLNACLDTIPPGAAVDASYFLVPHLAMRSQIYILPPHVSQPWVAVDPLTEPNPVVQAETRNLVRQVLSRGYGVVCSRGEALVLRKGARGRVLSPQMSRFLGIEKVG
jgi:uncharacterized membrane protein